MSRTYISGPLTSTARSQKTDLRHFYEQIAEACRHHGLDVYLPHLHTDPAKFPKLTPSEVYHKNSQEIKKAEMLIAYVGEPSLGVGSELELVNQNNIGIILLYEKGNRISRHARGIPSISKELQFSTKKDCLNKLSRYLSKQARLFTSKSKLRRDA